jgi:hypothetical protein
MPERDEVTDPVLLGASGLGCRLARNNSGVAFHQDGSVVRYGVFPGGSDLIGWSPLLITPEHVGITVAIFTAIEAKTRTVSLTKPQRDFLDIVNRAGGIGLWGRDPKRILAELQARLK